MRPQLAFLTIRQRFDKAAVEREGGMSFSAISPASLPLIQQKGREEDGVSSIYRLMLTNC
jgi:hypothetical protein